MAIVLLRRGRLRSDDDIDRQTTAIRVRDIEINLVTRTVHRSGICIDLAPKEFDLLVE
jgi:DNA-binding response OmpR family regulator